MKITYRKSYKDTIGLLYIENKKWSIAIGIMKKYEHWHKLKRGFCLDSHSYKYFPFLITLYY